MSCGRSVGRAGRAGRDVVATLPPMRWSTRTTSEAVVDPTLGASGRGRICSMPSTLRSIPPRAPEPGCLPDLPSRRSPFVPPDRRPLLPRELFDLPHGRPAPSTVPYVSSGVLNQRDAAGPPPLRLHGQHLPLPDRGGRDAAAPARAGPRGRGRGGQRRHRRLARGERARPPRDRGGARAGHRARGRGAAGRAGGLLGVRPDPGRRPAQPPRPRGRPACRRPGEAAPAAGVRPRLGGRTGPRRAGPLLRRGRRLRARAGSRRGRLPRAPGRPAGRRPAVIAEAAAAALGARVVRAERIAGGDLNAAWRLELEGGVRAFAKAPDGAAPGEYAAEAAGLRWLGEPDTLRVPSVLAADDRFLLLEWLDEGPLDAEAFGRGLAAVHTAGAPAVGGPPPGPARGGVRPRAPGPPPAAPR